MRTRTLLQEIANIILAAVGRPYYIYNPHGRRTKSLPVIFGYRDEAFDIDLHERVPVFPRGIDLMRGAMIAEDGTKIGKSFPCADEDELVRKLGCQWFGSDEWHRSLAQIYPDGYRMDFVGSRDRGQKREVLNAAISRAADRPDQGDGWLPKWLTRLDLGHAEWGPATEEEICDQCGEPPRDDSEGSPGPQHVVRVSVGPLRDRLYCSSFCCEEAYGTRNRTRRRSGFKLTDFS